jgi:hypothetical protein
MGVIDFILEWLFPPRVLVGEEIRLRMIRVRFR